MNDLFIYDDLSSATLTPTASLIPETALDLPTDDTASGRSRTPGPGRRRSKGGDTPEERLARVATAAHWCISRFGFRRTQMADVAKKAGLSAAALYSYAANKDALLTLAALHAMRHPLPGADALPVAPWSVRKLRDMVEADVARIAHWPVTARVLKRRSKPTRADLQAIAEEMYDLQSTNRDGIWLMDRLSVEIPEIDRLWATKGHGATLKQLIALIRKAPAPGIAVDVAARNAIEIMAWPSMHRHRDLWLRPDADEATIRKTATAQFVGAVAAAMSID